MILGINGIIAGKGGIVFDIDAEAFITAAGITATTQKTAINQLVVDLKANSIYNKFKAIYPFVGGTASSHKFNLKDPRDLDAAYRLVFSGGWTHSSTGAKADGTSGYANTFFSPLTQGMSTSSFHMSNYARQSATSGTSRAYLGSNASASPNNNLTNMGWVNSGSQEGGSIAGNNSGGEYSPTPSLTPSTAGYKILTTNGNRNARFYRNGVYQATQVTQSYSFDILTLYLSAINQFTVGAYNNTEHAFTSIGSGLSDSEALALHNAVQKFNTTLGRQV